MGFPFKLPELSAEVLTVIYGAVGLVAAIIVFTKMRQESHLDAFPTVGSTTWFGSWWACFKFLTNAEGIIQEGYEKHKSAPFKIAEPFHWTVILSNREHLEELARASEDELSLTAAMNDRIQIRYLFGPVVDQSPYHGAVLRGQLTRNIEALYSEIRDEMVASFDEAMALKGHEWKGVTAMKFVQQVVCRTSNRAFVGLPLCRDPNWIDLNIRYTFDIVKGGIIVGFFPKFMRQLAVRFLTNIPRSVTRGLNLLRPIIEERLKYLNEYGSEWDDKPNDLLSWLMDVTKGSDSTVESLTVRMLVVNFAAIHTTSNFFTQALFYLAAYPQYVQALRDEVEEVVAEGGWTKIAIGKMRKVDSFLRECLRFAGVAIVGLSRKAVKDYKFSDGTFVPKGTLIHAASQSLLSDRNIYENPEAFEPFRFVDMKQDGIPGWKHQFASTSTEHLGFGHGRHACPGRFFAAVELKTMLAHIVLNYDVKLGDGVTGVPPSMRIVTFISSNPHAKVMFRRRQDK